MSKYFRNFIKRLRFLLSIPAKKIESPQSSIELEMDAFMSALRLERTHDQPSKESEAAYPLKVRHQEKAFSLSSVRQRSSNAELDLHRIFLKFPWSYRFDIDPHTVHVGHVFYALSEIDAITNSSIDHIQKIQHLRLVTSYLARAKYADPQKEATPHVKLSLTYQLAPGSDFGSSLSELKENIELNSVMEAPTTQKSIGWIFEEKYSIFEDANFFKKFSRDESSELDDFLKKVPTSKKDEKNSDAADPLELIGSPNADIVAPHAPYQATVCVRVISSQARSKLMELSIASSKEDQKRYEAILRRLNSQDHSDNKPLCFFEPGGLSYAENFPNFSDFATFLNDQCMLAQLGDKTFSLPPILLLGDPGIGKTEFVSQLSQVVKTSFLKVDMGSAQTGAALAGSDIYWANSKQGQFFDLLAFGATANPIVFLDEIDKTSTDSRHSPVGALYSLLEKKTARDFCDLSLPGVKLDASHVIWVAAANDVLSIEPALLSRFRVFEIPTPTKAQMPVIVQSVYSNLLSSEKWGPSFNPQLSEQVLNEFVGIPPRMARQTLEAAVGFAARGSRTEIVCADIQPISRNKRIGF